MAGWGISKKNWTATKGSSCNSTLLDAECLCDMLHFRFISSYNRIGMDIVVSTERGREHVWKIALPLMREIETGLAFVLFSLQ